MKPGTAILRTLIGTTLLCAGFLKVLAAASSAGAPDGWTTGAHRDEVRPAFAFDSQGGRANKGALVIRHDEREGLDGWWTKTFPVQGGQYYRFESFRKTEA